MKKQIATKRDIITPKTSSVTMKKIHAIMLGLEKPSDTEQVLVAAVISIVSEGIPFNFAKTLSVDERMALSKLNEEITVNIK